MIRPIFMGLLLCLIGCSNAFEVGYDDAAGTGGSAADAGGRAAGESAGGAGGSAGSAPAGSCAVSTCQGKIYACGDCLDNDADGEIDALDTDCLGPCDNTEDAYFGGIPGQNNAPCREDCYFDQDSGSGNDRCDWNQRCDPLSIAPGYPPSGSAQCEYDPNANVSGSSCAELGASQPQACLDFCLPLTPNGCDCFGCCELPARSGKFVWIGSTLNGSGSCDQAHVADPSACAPCTPVPSCFNACDACEKCVGSNVVDPSCTGAPSCSVGTPCGVDGSCVRDSYCLTGCCIAVPR